MALYIALDIGGTFTDLVAFDGDTGALHHAKSSTTPRDLAVGIRNTLEKGGAPLPRCEAFVHGSTIAINTVIERSGARTALVTTRGTRDVYRIGRGNRPEAYNLFFQRPEPFVPRRAGGQPGPVCYDAGGTEPTVTDANVVLGRVNSARFLGGEMPLNVAKARAAIAQQVAAPLGLSVE